MASSSEAGAADIKVRLFGRDEPAWVKTTSTAESACLALLRDELSVRPVACPLFGFRLATGHKRRGVWLSPDQRLDALSGLVEVANGSTAEPKCLELRVRFKSPSPSRLCDLDKNAFLYYYRQVCSDYVNGDVIRKGSRRASGKNKWWHSVSLLSAGDDNHSAEEDNRKVHIYTMATRMTGLAIAIDIKERGCTEKEALKNFSNYLPNETYGSAAEKLVAYSDMKSGIAKMVHKWVGHNGSSDMMMETFLTWTEQNFPDYFDEQFEAMYLNGGHAEPVVLVIKSPFETTSPQEEHEPALVGYSRRNSGRNNARDEKELFLCSIDDMYSISATSPEDDAEEPSPTWQMQILHRNGVPISVQIASRGEALSFLSHLSGFYRLCEKWTFVLSSKITFPSLDFNLENNIHGPIMDDFVREKFAAKAKDKVGAYMISQSQDTHDLFRLHYVAGENTKLDVVTISRVEEGFAVQISPPQPSSPVATRTFPTLREIVSKLKNAEKSLINDCLHPSEYDKAPTLLLCRSMSKARSDVICREMPSGSGIKLVLSPKHLSRVENERFDGNFTVVWRGIWSKSKQEKQVVALKQLKPSCVASKFTDFFNMCNTVMTWEDGTLVKIFGIVLAPSGHSMTLVTEFFSLGPLDVYLQREAGGSLNSVHLLEASICLAKALWYLEENETVHGNIRCGNAFVSTRHDRGFQVKLGDPGMPGVYDVAHVPWLALELLVRENPHSCLSTVKSDVWALGTTLWQIFSYGANPVSAGVKPSTVRERIVAGERLAKPPSLDEAMLTHVYTAMTDCWNPIPGHRKQPQALLRDLTQVYYRYVNTKRIPNAYSTIPDDAYDSVSTVTSDELKSLDTSSLQQDLDSKSSTSTLSDLRQHDGGRPLAVPNLVPTFADSFRRMGDLAFGLSESKELLLNLSRPGSSLDDSFFQPNMSQFTSQTSLASYSTMYSMSSIYELDDDSQFDFSRDKPLGEGNFGIVYTGVMGKPNGDWEKVAVKMLKEADHISIEAMEEMKRELEIMRSLSHDNVVKIRAVRNDNQKVFIIMEFLADGSLDSYLSVHKDNIRFPHQLLIYADNIIDGMSYLGQKGIIHRDLAARNILVASEEMVKISDFGLARSAEKGYYVMSSSTNIPVKWLAIECLTHNMYSFSSDVWSFGVTLWEMFSFGASPFLDGCESFFKAGASDQLQRDNLRDWLSRLEEGARMPRPKDCPAALYRDIMMACWHNDPLKRPTFAQLKSVLNRISLQVT